MLVNAANRNSMQYLVKRFTTIVYINILFKFKKLLHLKIIFFTIQGHYCDRAWSAEGPLAQLAKMAKISVFPESELVSLFSKAVVGYFQ